MASQLLGKGGQVPLRTTRKVLSVLGILKQVSDGRGVFRVLEGYPHILQVSKLLYGIPSCPVESHSETVTRFTRCYEWLRFNVKAM